jgi:acetyl esterase
MQKLILGRALLAPEGQVATPRLIVAHQPTWGLDIGAVAYVQRQLIAARDAGIALRCQLLLYPLTDTREDSGEHPSRTTNADIPPLTRQATQFFNQHFIKDPAITLDWRVSPLLAPDLSGVAPALIVLAERDILHDEGLRYAERLRAAGVEVSVHTFPGMVHGFIQMGSIIQAADKAVDMCAETLRQRLLPV